ncbi:redoxin domain-containing protein [Haloarcula salinisoli]|uniref:thioredoxin-dependent peroxiredoxin n=1 Tax=Haloarcula salinisoli TaxID=2487746 RepID=A0A8J8C760_9EURY|nr:redoxin domain-containing protein [Halomicroarcula salinisoli]MBX0285562.1 redoxin domain-containing protein [Halomicroarcula salinisoli]MBX0302952.1 redoxin domain-containing protein [Halomicroarcula salinisoli]
MLDAGDPAPDFDLDGTDGERTGAYRLSAAAQRAPVLVAFYTADFEPRCRAFLEALRDTDWADLTDAIAVLGVAPGTIDDHRQFATDLELPFPLLVDHPGVDGQFGVQRPDGSTRRAAFLVDRRCRVTFSWADPEPGSETAVAPDIAPIRSAVAGLRESGKE